MELILRQLIISAVKIGSLLNLGVIHSNLTNHHGLKQFKKVERKTQLLFMIV